MVYYQAGSKVYGTLSVQRERPSEGMHKWAKICLSKLNIVPWILIFVFFYQFYRWKLWKEGVGCQGVMKKSICDSPLQAVLKKPTTGYPLTACLASDGRSDFCTHPPLSYIHEFQAFIVTQSQGFPLILKNKSKSKIY